MPGILEIEEREQLIPEVAILIAGRPIRLTTVIPQAHVIRIPTDPIPEQYAYQVVTYCERSAWVEDPALIIKLLDNWRYLPIFESASDRIRKGAPPKFYLDNRVWDTCLLALDLPFLNREKTRKAIEYFSYGLIQGIRPAGKRVLIINGPGQSGKSFTLDYISYVNSIFAGLNFSTIWIDFKKQVSASFTPSDLIGSLLDQIDPDWEDKIILPKLLNQQIPRWTTELVSVLVSQIQERNLIDGSNNHWVIVLDGFDDKKVSIDTLDLIQKIADVATGNILKDIAGDVVRLVLLGYDGRVTNYLKRVEVEDIQPVTVDDIRLYFKRFAGVRKITVDDAALDAMVTKIRIEELEGMSDRTKIVAQRALQIAKAVLV
jgi:hypothetical protein